jgi:ketose-bisphosphate aldolase
MKNRETFRFLNSQFDILNSPLLPTPSTQVPYRYRKQSSCPSAVAEAAEQENAPVILGFGCMMLDAGWLDRGGIETLGALGRAVATRVRAPVSLLLNEAHTYEQAIRGIDAGFNAVMLDTSAWPWPQAIEAVSKLVPAAHARGVAVEAELGRLPDALMNGIDDSTATLTDPDQAARFVEQTGADCLAVSIGNIHLLTDGYAPVDLAHLEAIHRRVSAPLVIHGGTSFPPAAASRAIAAGVAKFNVGTILKTVFLDGIRESMTARPARVDVHEVMGSHKTKDLMTQGKLRMKEKVREGIAEEMRRDPNVFLIGEDIADAMFTQAAPPARARSGSRRSHALS